MTLRYGREVFETLDGILPRKIAIIPYQIAFHVISSSLSMDKRRLQPKLWIRHSVALKEFVFGISDLDLTLWFEGEASSLERQECVRAVTRWKRPFVFLGEINCWQRDEATAFRVHANVVELKRDPVLWEMLGQPKLTKMDVLVFVLRNYWVDKEHLRKNPTSRERRWKRYFSIWSEVISELPVKWDANGIINWFVNQLQDLSPSHELSAVRDYLLKFDGDLAEFVWGARPKLISVLFPQATMWYHEGIKFEISSLSLWEKEFISRQVDWEIWGIMSQLPRYWSEKIPYQEHFSRLRRLMNELNSEAQYQGIDRLCLVLERGKNNEIK